MEGGRFTWRFEVLLERVEPRLTVWGGVHHIPERGHCRVGFSDWWSSNFENDRSLDKNVVGAAMNEKIELYFNSVLIESKTFPHLISAGVWTDFWLQLRKG